MSQKPSISIIVPVYKAELYLVKCIKSILAQTYTDFELILVDDGSPDKSGEICDYHATQESRIKVIHKKNGGVSSARNAGLDIAQGEYIGWVDSDDYIEPDMYETLYSLAKNYKAEIAEVNFAQVLTDKIIPCEFGLGLETGSGNFLLEKFLTADIFYGLVTKIFHHSLLKNVRFPVGRIYEDTWMTLYFCLEQHTYVRNTIVKYYYVQTHDSIIRSFISPLKAREHFYILENQLALINSKVKDIELKSRLHTRIMEKSVIWYLGLALSNDIFLRNIYARLYLRRMNYGILKCIKSKNIPIRNKVSYCLCLLHSAGLARLLKHSF